MSISLGICLGASTIKAVELEDKDGTCKTGNVYIRNHESNPRLVVEELFKELNVSRYDHLMVTGRKFREILNTPSITEAEAIESALAYNRLYHNVDSSEYTAIAGLGAESFIVYLLNKEGFISSVESGNKCASGTGEFFLQQIKRMNIDTKKAIELAKTSEMYRVSGRCSVFCKSDCTHALNKGVGIGKVAAGLCAMMAEKVLELLERVNTKKILATGGVTNNSVVMKLLENRVDKLTIPPNADVFEALGAAWYAKENSVTTVVDTDNLFRENRSSFMLLPPLSKGEQLVTFKESHRGDAKASDECIVGLDVGSTTTKAVVVRMEDNAVLGSVYLRTNGNPVEASRQCYRNLDEQLPCGVNVIGLAVTGSGRHIAGLHASTDSIINEIIAHATGAAFYDPDVDTIFEIGGQDAKYTHLTNGVPSDYAMNEACSAGTGSFLEESAYESLGIDYKKIETFAREGQLPPNFNDQCAAFISSDIKIATHEGISKEDITAGLVYSICMNYVNRVKGQRKTGNRIFMQGGVCYNKAVPLAMANLIERPIIVPPDPGLIGAFGVALELAQRIRSGASSPRSFDLTELSKRDIEHGQPFTCKGGAEKCDRGCQIAIIIIDGKKYPFGGACNKYYNQVHHAGKENDCKDLVRTRTEMVFPDTEKQTNSGTKTIGINRSFLTNTYYPFYSTFFKKLGFSTVLSDKVDPDGVKRRRSSFCFPGEIAHGSFYNLLKKDGIDYYFLPKIMGLPVKNSISKAKQHQCTCVLLQSEAYYLSSAFRELIDENKLLTPLFDFSNGLQSQKSAFVNLGKFLGKTGKESVTAFEAAVQVHNEFESKMAFTGKEFLTQLEKEPQKTAIVLFGRPYNAFAREANMGIPSKFSSRTVQIIPWDMLPFTDELCDSDMCWALGQNLLKAASFVKNHPQLFAAWITNFSCGPDSFLVGSFRDIMGTKPSLTLELDSHTADAGINTRIEAFLDIVQRYRKLGEITDTQNEFIPSKVVFENKVPDYITSNGKRVSFRNNRVHLLIPSMGRFASEIMAAAMKGLGVNSSAIPIYDYEALKFGRANTSCKECLPLLLTTGGLLKYLAHRKNNDELLAYFMPFTPGNCRFPQYRAFLNNLIRKKKLENVCIFSLTAEKGYLHDAFSATDRLGFLKAFIISDVMDDIKNALTVLALDKEEAHSVFEKQWKKITDTFNNGHVKQIYNVLENVADNLASIPLKHPLSNAKKVSLMGEIFVRRDEFSCRDLMSALVKRDIVVKKSHFFEWLKYVDYIVHHGIYQPDFTFKSKVQFAVKQLLQNRYEQKIKKILSRSNLYEYETIDIEKITTYGKKFFDLEFRGESILAVGGFFKEVLHSTHGMVSIGPFACMPTRVIEAVLSVEATLDTKKSFNDMNSSLHNNKLDSFTSLPFLSVETDGNTFPQILEARIESFCLQVERLYKTIHQA